MRLHRVFLIGFLQVFLKGFNGLYSILIKHYGHYRFERCLLRLFSTGSQWGFIGFFLEVWLGFIGSLWMRLHRVFLIGFIGFYLILIKHHRLYFQLRRPISNLFSSFLLNCYRFQWYLCCVSNAFYCTLMRLHSFFFQTTSLGLYWVLLDLYQTRKV